MGERCKFSSKMQLAVLKSGPESGDELATKHAPQYSNGKEEVWMGSNPAGVITGESAGGNDAVDMRMKLEFLFQGRQPVEKADLGSQMGRFIRHCEKSFGAGTK